MTFSSITYVGMLNTVCNEHKFQISAVQTIVMRYGGMRAMEQEQLLTEQMQEVRAPEV
jgi:hypothetical protein